MDSPCGAEGVGLRICPLLSCTRDIESHLVSLGLGSKRGATGSKVSEADLILNRAGEFDQGHPTMESFQMRPKCLKCIILCLESLFS